MSSKTLAYLQCLFRRLARLFSAVALAEKGCFDEVRQLRGDGAKGWPDTPPIRDEAATARTSSPHT